jgi:acetoin utilization deacetylase AcuC-like enzyme
MPTRGSSVFVSTCTRIRTGYAPNMIPVFYTPQQVVTEHVGASPSARKPAEVVASWQTQNFPIQIHEPVPATLEDFDRAHDPDFVRGVLNLTRANGFGNRSRAVVYALPWTSGSMLSAVRFVVQERVPVAVSPTSGFHHASYDRCEGFCTFNGLMVTVLALRADGFRDKIGILDLDEHYGNGTADIIERVGERNVEHYTFGGEGIHRGDGDAWLAKLPEIMKTFTGCGIVLYQAGADPHAEDPYSRGILSTEQLLERDRIVFRWLRAMRVPVVWNLAGGYQTPLRKVLDIHDNTMRACVEEWANE